MTGKKSSRLARCREAGPRTSPGATDRKLQRLPGPGLPDPWDAPLREVHPLPAQRCDPAPAHADMDADQQEAADRRFDVARPPTWQDFGRAQMHRRRPRSPPPAASQRRLDLDPTARPRPDCAASRARPRADSRTSAASSMSGWRPTPRPCHRCGRTALPGNGIEPPPQPIGEAQPNLVSQNLTVLSPRLGSAAMSPPKARARATEHVGTTQPSPTVIRGTAG